MHNEEPGHLYEVTVLIWYTRAEAMQRAGAFENSTAEDRKAVELRRRTRGGEAEQ